MHVDTGTIYMLSEAPNLCVETGGFTWWTAESQFANAGFVVGVSVGDWRVIQTSTVTRSDVLSAVLDSDLLTSGHGLGGWVDGDRTVLDPVAIFEDEAEAMNAAREFGQTHIFNLCAGAVLEVAEA